MKAAIFDMDGLLIDSEPLWQEAEINVFRSVGVPLTGELCRETVGAPIGRGRTPLVREVPMAR